MKIGSALALIAVGLILSYAVDFELPGIDIGALGAILFYIGLLGLVVTIGLEIAANRARHPPRPKAPRRERSVEPPPRAPAPRDRYDPIQPLPARPRPQPRRDPADDETRRLS